MTWQERIAAARLRGGFTKDDKERAASWRHCACGELSEGIPRLVVYDVEDETVHPGQPLDSELTALGIRFDAAIDNDQYDTAEQILALIQRRELEILADIRAQEARA